MSHRLLRRLLVLSLLVVPGLLVAGCGNKEEITTVGHTEGIYVDVDELQYQVQLSRILNPADREDQMYLRGLPAGTPIEAGRGMAWFGIFMRVQNPTGEQQIPSRSFRIIDTDDAEYEPIPLDAATNPFAYRPLPLPNNAVYPDPNSIAGEGDIQGSLILFKVKLESLQNRPLELEIDSSQSLEAESAVIDLDV